MRPIFLFFSVISPLAVAAFRPQGILPNFQLRFLSLRKASRSDTPQLTNPKKSVGKKPSLLLVDDEVYLRKAVKAYLEERGYEVRTVGSAADALREARREIPDLMVADITMPAVDGYQLVLQLRRYPEFLTLPVIFLTARSMAQDRIQGYQSGCDAYVTKPFDPEELVAIIENFLLRERNHRAELSRLRKELEETQRLLWKRAKSPPAYAENTTEASVHPHIDQF